MHAMKWILGIAVVGGGAWVAWRVIEAKKYGLSVGYALKNPTANLLVAKAASVSPAGNAATRAVTSGAGSF